MLSYVTAPFVRMLGGLRIIQDKSSGTRLAFEAGRTCSRLQGILKRHPKLPTKPLNLETRLSYDSVDSVWMEHGRSVSHFQTGPANVLTDSKHDLEAQLPCSDG